VRRGDGKRRLGSCERDERTVAASSARVQFQRFDLFQACRPCQTSPADHGQEIPPTTAALRRRPSHGCVLRRPVLRPRPGAGTGTGGRKRPTSTGDLYVTAIAAKRGAANQAMSRMLFVRAAGSGCPWKLGRGQGRPFESKPRPCSTGRVAAGAAPGGPTGGGAPPRPHRHPGGPMGRAVRYLVAARRQLTEAAVLAEVVMAAAADGGGGGGNEPGRRCWGAWAGY
jgi:hypothetical protein